MGKWSSDCHGNQRVKTLWSPSVLMEQLLPPTIWLINTSGYRGAVNMFFHLLIEQEATCSFIWSLPRPEELRGAWMSWMLSFSSLSGASPHCGLVLQVCSRSVTHLATLLWWKRQQREPWHQNNDVKVAADLCSFTVVWLQWATYFTSHSDGALQKYS